MKPKDLKLKDLDVGDLKAAKRFVRQMRQIEQPFSVQRARPRQPKAEGTRVEEPLLDLPSIRPKPASRTSGRLRMRHTTKPLRTQIKSIRRRYQEAARVLKVDLRDRSPKGWADARKLAHGARRNTESLWLADDALDQLAEVADRIDLELARYRGMNAKKKSEHKELIAQLYSLGLPLTLPLGIVELLNAVMTTMQAMAPMLAEEGKLIGSAFHASAVGVKRVSKRRDRKRTPA
jgi:hypothetical protein